MGKLLRPFVVFAAITGVMAAASVQPAPAQVKKDDKTKSTKADEVGVTEVYMAKDGWRFRIKNAEGKSIAIGTIGFEKKEDAFKAIDMIKTALTKGKVVEIKTESKK